LRSEQIDKMITQNAVSNLGYSWYHVFSTYLQYLFGNSP